MSEKDQPGEGGISRRGFLKGAGATVAATTFIGAAREGMAEAARASRPDKLAAGKEHAITLTLNGRKGVKLKVHVADTLLEVVREKLQLTGAKPVCEMGTCGACTLIVDGRPVNSCLFLAVDADGCTVETVEGLAREGRLHPVQQAFIEEDASQCGFCTPGMVMSCKALVDRNPSPTSDEVKEALSGNLCRCGTYANIFRAMERVASRTGRGR